MKLTYDVYVVVGTLIAAWLLRRAQPVPVVTTEWDWRLDPSSYPQPLKDFAQAIARAEGFYVQGSIPQRAHNPGNLTDDLLPPTGWNGPTLGAGIVVFPDDDAGWSALYRQLDLIVRGGSRHYTLDMTIAQMGERWTATVTEQGAWAANVARGVGATADTPLWSVLV